MNSVPATNNQFKLNPHQYIAINRSNSLRKLLRSHGITRNPANYNELVFCSQELTKRKGEKYTDELTEIHPDFVIFEKYFEKKYKPEIDKAKEEARKEARDKYYNVAGNETNKGINIDLKNSRTLDVLIGVGLATASIALIVSLTTAMKK